VHACSLYVFSYCAPTYPTNEIKIPFLVFCWLFRMLEEVPHLENCPVQIVKEFYSQSVFERSAARLIADKVLLQSPLQTAALACHTQNQQKCFAVPQDRERKHTQFLLQRLTSLERNEYLGTAFV
jgi:hypothetical protein